MSLDEFVGRIKTVEDRCDAGEDAENFDHDGKSFLLLAEEWLARYKNRGCAGKKKSTFDIRKVHCYNCQDYGHFTKDCTTPRKEHAHLAAATAANEPALL